MKSLVHTSRIACRQKPDETRSRSLWAMMSRGLARFDGGTQRANEQRVLERMQQLERLECDQRVRETGEW